MTEDIYDIIYIQYFDISREYGMLIIWYYL